MGRSIRSAIISVKVCSWLFLAPAILTLAPWVNAFTTTVTRNPFGTAWGLNYPGQIFNSGLHALPPLDSTIESSTQWIAAVEVFDGSEVDPVVVSNVFWAGLKTKMVSVIIGQFLSAAVFALVASVAASQISKLGSFISENILGEESAENKAASKPFIKSQQRKANTVTPDFTKLLLCIAIDIIGTSSELIPVFGEVTDVAWAPIAGLALRSLYGSNVLFVLEFAEEILPFTDILPLATLCWVVDTFYGDSDVAKALSLGDFSKVVGSKDVIDAVGRSEPDGPKLSGKDDFRS